MDRAEWQRAGALYLPLVAVAMAGLLKGRQPRQFAGCLLSTLWTLPALVVLQILNLHAGWWSFAAGSAVTWRGMPLELMVGWLVLWGIGPQLMLPRVGVVASAAVMAGLDVVLMPLCGAAVKLGAGWLMGEAVGVAIVLAPALCLGKWTREDTHLRARAVLQVITSGLLFLFLIPEVIFALRPGAGWDVLLRWPGWVRQVGLQGLVLCAVPGVGAVIEFVERGGGTPIPYDPPVRLVTSGMYRYCANPMQVACAVVMLAWAGALRSPWMALAAGVSVAYSAGIAAWDEEEDLRRRFGKPWVAYRAEVRSWRWRWRPYHAGSPAVLYVARGCAPCREVRAWLEARRPAGLRLADAEELPAGSVWRMRYDARDGSGTVDGVRALGRALEHLHLGWAIGGTALRLPGIWQGVQLVMDASGLGPRSVTSRSGSICRVENTGTDQA